MKKLLLATGLSLLAASATFATPANSEVIATGALVSMCKNKANAAEQNFCHGFSQGVYDFYVASRHPTKNPPFVCIKTPHPTRGVVIDNFVAWSAANPKFNQASAADTLMRYMAGTYPCKK